MLNVEKEMVLLHVPVYQAYKEIPTLSANQSVPSIQNVHQTKHVSTRNVWIHVQEYVEHMHHVQYRTTTHHVPVIQDTQETHLDTARELQHVRLHFIGLLVDDKNNLFQCLHQQKLLIHVSHLHVDQMQFVMRETGLHHVNVSLITLEILMLHVDQSVLSTLIVLKAKLVNNFTALIHAQEHVV